MLYQWFFFRNFLANAINNDKLFELCEQRFVETLFFFFLHSNDRETTDQIKNYNHEPALETINDREIGRLCTSHESHFPRTPSPQHSIAHRSAHRVIALDDL